VSESPAGLEFPVAGPPAEARPEGSPWPIHHVIYPTPLDAGRSLLSIIVVALFILTFIIQPFRIPSESMERTLLVGDFLLVNKMTYSPAGHWSWVLPYRDIQRGDIIVFRFPLDPSDHVVKRVIGLPGDHIRLRDGVVYFNGQPQRELYVAAEVSDPDAYRDQFPAALYSYTDPGVDTQWWLEMRHIVHNGELIVPPDSYFALGDNRNHSRDSRYWGFVPRQNIVGRPILIYFSLRRPSATDPAPLPDDRLGHDRNLLNAVFNFARWDRMFRIVR
jgi:signal peptidase I